MLFTSEIIDDMIDEINQNLMPENCYAIRGFDTKDLPIPLKKTYLSFIPEKNTVSYFEDDVRELCQKSEATIRMTCFSPLVTLASDTHILLEEVLKFLNDRYLTEISGYTIGETEYDTEVKAFRIVCRIFYERESCPAINSGNPSITVPHNFFCKTHVTDTDIHITAKEHEKYNEPFVTGTYTGYGYDVDQDIDLGFRPKFVLVFRVGYFPVYFDSDFLQLRDYVGFAIRGYATKNIKLTQTGFTIVDKSAADGKPEVLLNSMDSVYAYIAFK